eukprot:XP_001701235.1 nucleosome assembly protein [Chlamydomonas reinhardtii]
MAEKKVFAAIEAIEVQMEATHKKRQERQEELLMEYLRARQPLLERRLARPPSPYTAEFQPRGTAASAAAAAAAGSPSAKGAAAAAKGGASSGGGSGRAGVPFFWLNALCNELDPTMDPDDDDDDEDEDEDLDLDPDFEEGEVDDEEGGGEGGRRAQRMAQRQAQDKDILDILVKKVVPRAASLYLSGGGAAAASGTAAASGGAAAGSGGRKKKKKTKGGKQQAEEEDAEEEEEEGGFTLVSGSPAGAADIAALPLATQKTLHALVLEFLPGNPYFTNAVLRKHITFLAPGGSLTKLGVESAQSDPIDWQPGRDLTVRVDKPKPGGGGGSSGGGGRPGRARPVPSFFHFFSNAPGALCRAFNIPGQGRAAQAEAIQAQEEFMAEVINLLTYFAGRLAVESYVDVDDLGDEKEDEEEDEEEEDEDEVLTFMDTLEFVRSRFSWAA